MKKFITLLTLLIVNSLSAQTATAPSGDGTELSPYIITSLDNLYWISDQVNNHAVTFTGVYFKQSQDIDATNTSTWFSGEGWMPIGYSTNNGFSTYTTFFGNYNGQNHVVSNLYINRTGKTCVGLFGMIQDATIKNLGVTNINFSAGSGDFYVGGLIGYAASNSTIQNCYATGTLSGGWSVGGLIGDSGVDEASNNIFTDCYANCTVTALSNNAAGFVAESYGGSYTRCYSLGDATTTGNYCAGFCTNSTSEITLCYSKCNVNATNNEIFAGFVGYNYGELTNCYSTGNVITSGKNVGGFIGYYSDYLGKLVTNCYSTGKVVGSSNVGGFIATNSVVAATNVVDCFWDMQTSEIAASPGGGTGKTTLQMKTQATFTNWDYTNVWEIIGGDGANYPRLKALPDVALPVELISFSTLVSSNKVILTWETATEINNYGFEIQKSVKTNNPFTNFTTIGFVKGFGNSNSINKYQFEDINISNGNYIYRLKQIDNNGNYSYSQTSEVDVNNTPQEYCLTQNYPNPFNPKTIISFNIPQKEKVTLKIYDVLGAEITTLINEELIPGNYSKIWNAEGVCSGVYFYKLTTGNFAQTKKMILTK